MGSRQFSVLYNKQFADMTAFLQYYRNPFVDRKPEKKAEQAAGGGGKPEETSKAVLPPPVVQPPTQQPPALQPPNSPLEPKAVQGKPAPREFEPVKPLDPGTQV